MKIPPAARLVIETKIPLELTETEARALAGIFGYSVDAFLTAFYEKMGRSYVQPYAEGVRSLHAKMRVLSGPLAEIDKFRKEINAKLAANPCPAPRLFPIPKHCDHLPLWKLNHMHTSGDGDGYYATETQRSREKIGPAPHPAWATHFIYIGK